MSIQTTCSCGAKFKAKDELAGKRVKCPACGQPLSVPAQEPAGPPIHVACQCGQAFQANASLAGKAVACPACSQKLMIPDPKAAGPSGLVPLDTSGSNADPFGSVPSTDDPLGIEDQFNDPLAGGPLPATGYTQNASVSRPADTGKPKKKRKKGLEFNGDVLVMVTAILCIIHGLGRIGSMYRIVFLITSRAIFSFGGLMSVVIILASAGILAAGVGLLTKQEWGKQIGQIAGYAYLAILIISVFMSMITLARLANTPMAGMVGTLFVRQIISTVAQSIVPGMLIYVTHRGD